jgi:hypothetical protein
VWWSQSWAFLKDAGAFTPFKREPELVKTHKNGSRELGLFRGSRSQKRLLVNLF